MLDNSEDCLGYINSVVKDCARGKFGNKAAIHKIKRIIDAYIHLEAATHRCSECKNIINELEKSLEQAQSALIDAHKDNIEAVKVFNKIIFN